MKMSPGPFRVIERVYIDDANGDEVANVVSEDEFVDGNAKLFVEAPILLQIVRDILVADETWIHDVERRAKAALARIDS